MTARIPARSRRQAMDWSLVLISQGIETTIEPPEESGWGLSVPAHDYDRALEVLKQYHAENRHWPWRQRISEQGVLFDWGSIGWAASAVSLLDTKPRASDASAAGLIDAAAVSHGEWWRLFTAIFLHADLGHLAMNASIGLALLGLTMGSFGTGIGLLAACLAGVGGNLTTWLVFSEGHLSLGASGMVMGCVGLLAAKSVPLRIAGRWKYAITGLIGGIMLFALLA